MNKKDLIAAFISYLEKEMALLKAAALATHDAATNEESRPENEYDTRALEASYLAGAQAKRVNEIDEVIVLFRTLKFKEFAPDDSIALTALVTIEMGGKQSQVLVMPKGGGINCQVLGKNIQIVTLGSVLGEAIMGLAAGDIADYEVGSHSRECKILSVG
jgi:hypothetical protein